MIVDCCKECVQPRSIYRHGVCRACWEASGKSATRKRATLPAILNGPKVEYMQGCFGSVAGPSIIQDECVVTPVYLPFTGRVVWMNDATLSYCGRATDGRPNT